MKAIIYLAFLFIFCASANAQMAMSFYKLPQNNKMADTSLAILGHFTNCEIEKIVAYNPKNRKWRDSIKTALAYMNNRTPADTMFTEYYYDNETKVEFRFDCGEVEKDLTYWLIVESSGVSGSTKDLIIKVKPDYNFTRFQNELKNLKPPKY